MTTQKPDPITGLSKTEADYYNAISDALEFPASAKPVTKPGMQARKHAINSGRVFVVPISLGTVASAPSDEEPVDETPPVNTEPTDEPAAEPTDERPAED